MAQEFKKGHAAGGRTRKLRVHRGRRSRCHAIYRGDDCTKITQEVIPCRISTRTSCRFRTELRRDGKRAVWYCRCACRTFCMNGADGIAVGMATSIPPHNLCEKSCGCGQGLHEKRRHHRQNGLMKYIKGPDFPTGGIVVNQDDLPDDLRDR